MATSYTVKHSQDAQIGIKGETSFGAGVDTSSNDGTNYRRIPMVEAPKPTFNVTRESRMLSGRGSIKDAGDTLLITKGGTVTAPFDFIATPELLLQHLALVGQVSPVGAGTNIYDMKFDGSSNKQSIGGTITDNIPHTVNLAYMPSASGKADGIKVTGVCCSDLSIKGDYGTNSGCITMSGNYWSGFSNPTAAGTVLEQTFDGSWTDPDENVFIHMGDLGTKTLDVEAATNQDVIIKGFEINIANNVNRIGGDGSGNPEMYTMPQYDITGNLTIKHDDNFDLSAASNVLQSFLSKDTLSLNLGFHDGAINADGEMTISAEIQITADPTVENSDQGVFWNLPFECLSVSGGNALKVSLFSGTNLSAM